ncbi:WhiB family transcriptional regulator [Yimella lutea]|nr:WhiB family transcriptional regulator [Yimella lutea]
MELRTAARTLPGTMRPAASPSVEERWPDRHVPAEVAHMRSNDLQWACSGHPQPEIFFPNTNRDLSAAKKICSDCPAKLMCGRAGVESLESGVWGGTLLHNGVPNNRLFTREYPGAGRKKATTQSA